MEKLSDQDYIKKTRKELRENLGLSSKDPRVAWIYSWIHMFVDISYI